MVVINSYHRDILDRQLERHTTDLFGTVLDIGGGTKRGAFIRPEYALKYITLDRNKSTRPTVIGDAHYLPFKDGRIHSIKCTEVLEYLDSPEQAVSEMFRVLMDTGEAIISVPFNMGTHYDNDLVRFTRTKIEKMFDKDRFKIAYLTEMGLFFTVLGYMLKQSILNTKSRTRWLLYWTFPFIDLMVKLDGCDFVKNSKFLSSFTTGYFIVVIKWS